MGKGRGGEREGDGNMPLFAVSPQTVLMLTVFIWTKCHQNCTECREIYSIESFEIRIVILQSASKCQADKVDCSAKKRRFSTIVGCHGNVIPGIKKDVLIDHL